MREQLMRWHTETNFREWEDSAMEEIRTQYEKCIKKGKHSEAIKVLDIQKKAYQASQLFIRARAALLEAASLSDKIKTK
jgi:hypothetical protein